MRSSVSAADLDSLRAAVGAGVVPPYALAPGAAGVLTAGTLMWSWQHAHRVLLAWRTWVPEMPDDGASVARILRAPHLAGVAPALRGRGIVGIDVAIPGAPALAARRLAALRRLGPEFDSVAAESADELLARRPPLERPQAIGEHVLLRELPEPAVDAFIAAVGPGSGTELVAAELRHLGGSQFAVVALGVPGPGEQAERVRIALDQLVRRLAPWTG